MDYLITQNAVLYVSVNTNQLSNNGFVSVALAFV